MLDTLIQGLLLGGLYALFALGLSLMFGVMRLTNTAQGDFIVLAGFAVIAAVPWIAQSALGATLVILPVAFAAGYALQRWVLNGTLGRDPLPSLVVTFGLSIVIQNALLEVFSADPRSLDSGGFSTRSLVLGQGVAIGALPLAIFVLALAITASLQALFDRTSLGRAFRAVSDDREIAELMGLDARKV
jgi:branched-chain amino acid transport system permease protein